MEEHKWGCALAPVVPEQVLAGPPVFGGCISSKNGFLHWWYGCSLTHKLWLLFHSPEKAILCSSPSAISFPNTELGWRWGFLCYDVSISPGFFMWSFFIPLLCTRCSFRPLSFLRINYSVYKCGIGVYVGWGGFRLFLHHWVGSVPKCSHLYAFLF